MLLKLTHLISNTIYISKNCLKNDKEAKKVLVVLADFPPIPIFQKMANSYHRYQFIGTFSKLKVAVTINVNME